MADKEEGGFKVVDRRSFDAQGNPREEAAAKQPAEKAAGEPGAGPAGAPGGQQGPSAYHVGESAENLGPIDFSQFVLSIAQLAFVFIGDLPSPQTGRRERNVGAARQQIDLLVLLREKTKGNLSADEKQLLDTLLYELQVRFVEVMGEQGAGGKRA